MENKIPDIIKHIIDGVEIEEVWKPIENYPNYKISNYGRVKSLNYRNLGYEGLLIGNKAGCEYQKVYLYNLIVIFIIKI